MQTDYRSGTAICLRPAISRLLLVLTAASLFAESAPPPSSGVERYKAGIRYLKAGEYEKASASLQAAVDAGFRNLGARLHLTHALFGARHIGRAYEQAREVLASPPNAPDSLISLGELFLAHLFYEDAATVFQLALTSAPGSFEARFFSGLTLHLLERHGKAVEVLTELESSGNAEALTLLASARAGAGHQSAAIDLLRKLIQEQPASPHPYINLALILLDSGDHNGAEALLREFTGLDNARLAKVFYLSRRRTCDTLLPVPPEARAGEFPEAYDLALAFQSRYHHGSAIELFLVARRYEGDTARVLHGLGVSCLNLEPSSDAPVRLLRAALDLEPGRHETSYMLGRAYSRRFESEAAIAAFGNAIRLHPSVRYNAALGEELDRSGQAEASVAAFTRALELDPKHSEALVGLARVLIRLGRLEESIPYLDRSIAAEPENEQALYLLGAAHRRLGNADKASAFMADFRRAKIAANRRSSLKSGFVSGR